MKRTIFISILILLISCKKDTKENSSLVLEYYEKGIEYQMEKKLDSAIFYYKKAIKIDSTDILIYESLIKTYWNNDQPDIAMELLSQIPKELENNNSILILKGMTLERMDDLKTAIYLYQEAFMKSKVIEYNGEDNLMEFMDYITLQTVAGQKVVALRKLDVLKSKEISQSDKAYIESIEPFLRSYKGNGYLGLTNID